MRHLTKTIAWGITLGILLIVCKNFFEISDHAFWKLYLNLTATVILIACAVNIIYYTISMRKILKLAPILEIELNPHKFIEENRKLQATNKNKYIRTLINLNLVAAYCDLNEFDTAMQILKSCNIKELKGINTVVYQINNTYLHFRLNENDRAVQLMEQNKKIFFDFRNNTTFGGAISVLNIYNAIAHDNIPEAKVALSVAQTRWHIKRLEQDFDYLEKVLAEQ